MTYIVISVVAVIVVAIGVRFLDIRITTKRKSIQERKTRFEHKQLERELQESRRMETLGQIARGASHDFNHILGVFKNYLAFLTADLTEESLTNPKVQEDLETLMEVVFQGEEVSARLRAFSQRTPNGNVKPVYFSHMVNYLEPLMNFPGVEIIKDLKTLPAIMLDPAEAQQVILNLAFNARDAMPEGGVLTFRTQLVEGEAILIVTDTGHGMSEEVKEHIFDPFYTTKPKTVGSGLGLSTIYGIVSKAGGRISVQSSPEGGSTFVITLPLAPPTSPKEPGDA